MSTSSGRLRQLKNDCNLIFGKKSFWLMQNIMHNSTTCCLEGDKCQSSFTFKNLTLKTVIAARALAGPFLQRTIAVQDRYFFKNSQKPLIRMSWNMDNLKNLFQYPSETKLPDLSRMTVYQQKWNAKKFLRGYHVPNITETQFLDRHFQTALPIKFHSKEVRKLLPPIQSIAFGELERRVDVAVFRSCFATSIWNARKLVLEGHVKVNGEISRFPARRLQDGDMITVSPLVIPTLKTPTPPSDAKKENDEKVQSDASTPAQTLPRQWSPVEFMSPWIFIPTYLEVDFATCSAVFLRSPLVQPRRMEIPSPFPPSWHQLAYEWYARKKISQKKILEKPQLVLNGQAVKLKPKFDRIARSDLAAAKSLKEQIQKENNKIKNSELRGKYQAAGNAI